MGSRCLTPTNSCVDRGPSDCCPRSVSGLNAEDRYGSWLRKNVSERSKATSDWLASTLRRADWLFLRLRGLETLLKLPEVILSDLETPRQPAAQARIAARSGFTPTMFITRVRL